MGETADEDRTGTILGDRYTLRQRLGGGAHGVVYRAWDARLDREVAVKLVARGRSAEDTEARFLREARVAARVTHPGVVRVFDVGRDAGAGAFLVQEFLDGPSLRAWLDERLVATPAESLEVLRPVMNALAAAHARGVIHQDVKPENVILARGEDGALAPTVIDFGAAALTDAADAPPRAGTPAYMAPELAQGRASVDLRVDVWAVGVMLYEMLLGHRPYEADGHRALLAALAHAEPIRFSRSAPDASAALCGVVERALAPSPDDRFVDLLALRDALAACPEAQDPHARWAPRPRCAARTAPTTRPRCSPPPAPRATAPSGPRDPRRVRAARRRRARGLRVAPRPIAPRRLRSARRGRGRPRARPRPAPARARAAARPAATPPAPTSSRDASRPDARGARGERGADPRSARLRPSARDLAPRGGEEVSLLRARQRVAEPQPAQGADRDVNPVRTRVPHGALPRPREREQVVHVDPAARALHPRVDQRAQHAGEGEAPSSETRGPSAGSNHVPSAATRRAARASTSASDRLPAAPRGRPPSRA